MAPSEGDDLPAVFNLETTCAFKLPSRPIPVKVYKHRQCDFRVIFADVRGPLASATIVVGTLADDHKGLPHTLEHLVFCGSKRYPHRGFLDSLANRQLANGTNAYTAEDHTAYSIVTAGQQGLCEVLPVFIDHVLNPTLRDEQFITEVYHVDGQAKSQGVVFSEMASREHTEADLLDLNLRQLIYPTNSTYAYECGGLTPDIARLTNDDIKRYHQLYYQAGRLTVIISGDGISSDRVLRRLAEAAGLVDEHLLPELSERKLYIPNTLSWGGERYRTRTVLFPSSDDTVGSVGYAWLGPRSEDIRMIMAIGVLFRYLSETKASPLSQRFVERNLASHIDYDLKGYVTTAIALFFSGVPVEKSAPRPVAADSLGAERSEMKESTCSDDEDSESEMMSDSDEDPETDGSEVGDHDPRERMLCSPGNLYGLLMDVLKDFVERGFASESELKDTLARHRVKVYETIEDDPHEAVTSYLIPDIINLAFGDVRDLRIGTRTTICDVLDSLEAEPPEFWTALARRWLLDAPVAEVIMIPDPKLGCELEEAAEGARQERAAKLGPAGLEAQAKIVADAVEKNKVNLPAKVIASMPPIPPMDSKSIPQLPCKQTRMQLLDKPGERPFHHIQHLETDTLFAHLKIGLSTSMLDEDLRPYLVLFQELIFNAPVFVEGTDSLVTMDYKDFARELARDLVSHESAVGLGNDVFACTWLSEVFVLDGVAEPKNFDKLCRALSRGICLSQFPRDRILTVAKNLLSNISEIKRSGDDILAAVSTRVTVPLRGSETAENLGIPEVVALGKDKGHAPLAGNDVAISIFRQEAFLRRVVKTLSGEDAEQGYDGVLRRLERLRDALLLPLSTVIGEVGCLRATGMPVPGFVNMATPAGHKFLDARSAVDTFTAAWDVVYGFYEAHVRGTCPASNVNKRKASPPPTPDLLCPFPYPREPYVPPGESFAVMMPLPSLTSSYFTTLLPCDILLAKPGKPLHEDYYATLIMCELISRCEGPLYEAIRGQGYAYGSSVSAYSWIGQLAFEIHDAADPRSAIRAFHEVIRNFDTRWADFASVFDIETAQATCAYRICTEGSTAEGVIAASLRAALRGFRNAGEPIDDAQKRIGQVTATDLRRVFDRWFKPFLTGERAVTVLLTPPNPASELLQEHKPWFKEVKLDELAVQGSPDEV